MEEFFAEQHEEFLDSIHENDEEKFKYLDALFTINHTKIQTCIGEYFVFSK